MARIFNILPERQAKVNYLLASQEKAEAAKVMLIPETSLRTMPFSQRQNLYQCGSSFMRRKHYEEEITESLRLNNQNESLWEKQSVKPLIKQQPSGKTQMASKGSLWETSMRHCRNVTMFECTLSEACDSCCKHIRQLLIYKFHVSLMIAAKILPGPCCSKSRDLYPVDKMYSN